MDCIVSFIFHFPSTSLTAGKERDGKEKNVAKLRYLCAENVRRVCVVFFIPSVKSLLWICKCDFTVDGDEGGGVVG